MNWFMSCSCSCSSMPSGSESSSESGYANVLRIRAVAIFAHVFEVLCTVLTKRSECDDVCCRQVAEVGLRPASDLRCPSQSGNSVTSLHVQLSSATPHHYTLKMILRQALRPWAASIARPLRQQCRRTLIAAPKEGDGPLMTRRSDRALPTIASSRKFLRTMPLFLLVVGGSTLAIFNYQKSSSSVVTSSLYALRVNPKAREVLGEEIYFGAKIPWIWGTIDQMHGRIDIRFGVKGTKGKGEMWFKSERKTRMGYVSCVSVWEGHC